MNSSNLGNFKVKFKDLFPISLTTLEFDAADRDVDYFTADVGFKYTMYNLTDMDDKLL